MINNKVYIFGFLVFIFFLVGFIFIRRIQKRIRIEKTIKSIINADISESEHIINALKGLKKGHYQIALVHLKFAALNSPERVDIKEAITKLDEIVCKKH